ncbi:MAG: pectate lyase [Paludibacteraceae bacterium]
MKIRTLFLVALSVFTVGAQAAVKITKSAGWLETVYAEWTPGSFSNYHAYVRPAGGEYTQLDAMLLRDYGSYMRVDALGLKAGSYQLKIVPVDNSGNEVTAEATETSTLTVAAHDRNGFAHFNYSKGVGAYNNDGTLKAGAKVFYVTKNTAKTISTDVVTGSNGTKTTCVGMQAIIDAYQKGQDKTPIAFRIIGTIQASDMDGLSSSAEGLQIKGKNSYSEMNITIEGVGIDATLKGFGILCRNASSIEMRNFGVMTLLDDGISLDTDNSHIWIHNVDVYYGPNKGGDQAKGDGAMDVKGDSQYITFAYNHFWDSGKTSLCGMTSESGPNYITYHHNWFDHSDSRHPRIRTMTVHVYNNYYDGCAKYGVGSTTGSDVFVESNYFRNCGKPMLVSLQGTDVNSGVGSSDETKGTFSGEAGGSIKAYNNVMTGSYKFIPYSSTNSTHFDAYVVSNRSDKVPASVTSLSGSNTYSNFDTDASLMPSITPDDPNQVPAIVTGDKGAGRCEHGDCQYTFNNSVDDASYEINSALANLVTNYTTTLVGIVGGEESGTGTGGGEEPADPTDPTDPTNPTDPTDPTDPSNPGTSTGEYECHFTGKKPSNSFYTIIGNYSDSKGSFTAPNGTTYTECLKIESSTSVKFTTVKDMTLYLGFASTETSANIKVDGVVVTAANSVIMYDIAAGDHELTKKGSYNLFYINLYTDEEEEDNPDNPGMAVRDATTTTLSFNGSAILNPEGKFFRLYTISGSALGSSSRTEVSTEYLPQGVYVVVAEGETMRFVVK